MSVGGFNKAATSTGSNDFSLAVGVTGNTTFALDRTYIAGRYAIAFANNDSTYDIYAIAKNGTHAGYTSDAGIEISADFEEVVVLGATASESITFTYMGALTTPSAAGDVVTAGAFISNVVTSSLPNADDTTVLNGGNFAPDVQVTFINQSLTETAAKAVVRSSSSQLIITRPDSFTIAGSPYTLRVTNPGIPAPEGSDSHILADSTTPGTNPSWNTSGTQYYLSDAPTSITLSASDSESSVEYSIASGSLPTGLNLDAATGVISGTYSGAEVEGHSRTVTFTATDEGNNFLNTTLNFVANALPSWTTAAGDLEEPTLRFAVVS
jgi:hypothetical protein